MHYFSRRELKGEEIFGGELREITTVDSQTSRRTAAQIAVQTDRPASASKEYGKQAMNQRRRSMRVPLLKFLRERSCPFDQPA